jgi:ATP-dependent exoDNAse (exonuclease V) alpha subunit
VALIGDRHQLPAVGRGGVLDLAVRYAVDRCIEYGGVHRFTDPAYADLSLRVRSGRRPDEVFDELVQRGDIVIHASEVERRDILAVKASRGQLVVADTREQVFRINHEAHRARVMTGEAADSVVTASGEQIGTGDTIATRQNNAEVDVANRETWTVVDSSPAGLLVTGESGQRVLPPAYGNEHIELAYATTAYGAQGSTVNTSHVIICEHTGAASAYVGMTRGRERTSLTWLPSRSRLPASSGSRCSDATAATSARHTQRTPPLRRSIATGPRQSAPQLADRHNGASRTTSPTGRRRPRRAQASDGDSPEGQGRGSKRERRGGGGGGGGGSGS